MKIALLADNIPPEGRGGAERVAWESAVALAQEGHEVSIITTTQSLASESNSVSESEKDGVRIFSIPTNYHARWRAWVSLYNPRPVREVKRLLEELHPDIIHAHNVHQYLSYATLRVASKYKKKSKTKNRSVRIFHTIHDLMPVHYGKLSSQNYRISAWQQIKEYRFRYNPFRNLFIRRALRHVDVKFAVSNALREVLMQNGLTDIEVLYNGIDASEWKVSENVTKEFIRKHDLEGKKIILFGGRLSGAKKVRKRCLQRFLK